MSPTLSFLAIDPPRRRNLAARWATVLDRLDLECTPRPHTFTLPNGTSFTPDFYVEGMGWVVTRPSFTALARDEETLKALAAQAADLVPDGYVPRFFALVAPAPSLQGHLVEFTAKGFLVGGRPLLLGTLCAPHRQWLRTTYPQLYTSFVERAFRGAKREEAAAAA